MVHQEHDDHTEQGAEKGDPLVVIPGIQCHNLFLWKYHSLEAWPPAGRFSDARVKDAEVDQGIGGHEEVAEQAADHVEVADEDADERDGEDKDVAAQGVVICTPARGKYLKSLSLSQKGISVVFTSMQG